MGRESTPSHTGLDKLLTPSGLPGIRRLIHEVHTELVDGSLVCICIPGGANRKIWLDWMSDALQDRIRESGQQLPTQTLSLSGSLSDPLSAIRIDWQFGNIRGLEGLLQYHPEEGPLIIIIECNKILSKEWKSFLKVLGKSYRSSSSQRLRQILVLIVGANEYPPIKKDIGSKIYAIWNILRWEDLRLLAIDKLPQNENALTRSWRVSTYTGAANGDPILLSRCCYECPDHLNQLVDLALADVSNIKEISMNLGSVSEQRWNVPPECIAPWSSGDLLGLTADRDALRTLTSMSHNDAGRYIRAAIWREQLSGLFPAIVELSFNITPLISNIIGSDWLNEIPV